MQLFKKNNKKKLIVCFTGLAHKLCGITLERIKREVPEKNYDILWLEDKHRLYYLFGINEEIDSFEKLKEYLKEYISQYDQTRFIGGSGGSYGAVLFGSILDVETICFSGFYDLSVSNDAFLHHLLTIGKARRDKWKQLYKPDNFERLNKFFNLYKVRNESKPKNKAILHYPLYKLNDAIFSTHMQHSYNTILKACPSYTHCSCLTMLKENGKLKNIFTDDIQKIAMMDLSQ